MSNETHAEQEIDDLSSRRLVKSLSPTLRATRVALADAINSIEDTGGAPIFEQRLCEMGLPHDAMPLFTTVMTYLGFVCGRTLSLSSDDMPSAHERVLRIFEAVTDRHRENIIGKGYMFRLDPAYADRVWPNCERDIVDQFARVLRALTLEVCEMTRDDAKAVAIVRMVIGFSFDMMQAAR